MTITKGQAVTANVDYSISEATRIGCELHYLVSNKDWFMSRPYKIDGYRMRLRESIRNGERMLFSLALHETAQQMERTNRQYAAFFGPTGKAEMSGPAERALFGFPATKE